MRANQINVVAAIPPSTVIPANAGIQVVDLIGLQASQRYVLDSRIRGNDGKRY